MSTIYIAGIAMTVFGRHGERSLESLAREALDGALGDAGCSRADPGIAFYSGMTNGYLQGQIGNPDGDDKPNKKYYDPRVWQRAGQVGMIARIEQAFQELNSVNTL